MTVKQLILPAEHIGPNCDEAGDVVLWVHVPAGFEIVANDRTEWEITDTDYNGPEPGTDLIVREKL
jgi:hypothetical protein